MGVESAVKASFLNPSAFLSKKKAEDMQAEFLELFKNSDSKFKKKAKRSPKRNKYSYKSNEKKKVAEHDFSRSLAPVIDLAVNPSLFAVYWRIRLAILERQVKDSANIYLSTTSDLQADSDADEDNQVKEPIQIAKVVGIGLCSVFELIHESRTSHPSLCARALQALLDLLQGQQPEGLKSEPNDVINSLFDSLLNIATTPSPASHVDTLTSLACACLLSLVVARGDTGKMLQASSALLMSQTSLNCQVIKLPGILSSLQRSIHAVLLGNTFKPDWLTYGIRQKSLVDTIHLCVPTKATEKKENNKLHSALASDGRFLYVASSQGLFKVGSGYGGTIKGHVYLCRSIFNNGSPGWLAFAKGQLFYKVLDQKYSTLTVIDRETLKEGERISLEGDIFGPNIMFSDGERIGHIAASRNDNFVVRWFSPAHAPMHCMGEVTLKLARKCLDTFGYCSISDESGLRPVAVQLEDDDIAQVVSGKEFSMIRTMAGKVLFTGKPQSLGLKQGGPLVTKWTELPIIKSPKIVHCAVGHDGQHALLVSEEGTVFFTGLARRGEDGDSNKSRRQLKPIKPKKMIRLEGKHVVYAACSNDTSAIVTKDGQLYMFGKDTQYCDSSGLVTDLKDVVVCHVALGKAHTAVLTNKGKVYSFGVNNKGQCGREFCSQPREVMTVAMTTANEEELEDEEVEYSDIMCAPGRHRWDSFQCMVCTICGECTGYGSSCISSGRPDRQPGMPCGCGSGDAGCSECGCCRICAGAARPTDRNSLFEVLAKTHHLMPANLSAGKEEIQGGQLAEGLISRHADERKGKLKNKLVQQVITRINKVVDEGSDQEQDKSKMCSLPPGPVLIGNGDVSAVQVVCGLHHTVVLVQNGDVYAFGNGQYGQLGQGDSSIRELPTKVVLPGPAVQVASGSNFTAVLTTKGQVLTFGSHQKGQLGRILCEGQTICKAQWNSLPGPVPGIGLKHGRRAMWISASSDQTFVRIDESLVNLHSLRKCNIIASKTCIGVIPSFEDSSSQIACLMINPLDGTCRSFPTGSDQADLIGYSVCLDPLYNVLWSFNPTLNSFLCYNVIAAEARLLGKDGDPNILSPELSLPAHPGNWTTRSHTALHLLGALDTLTLAQNMGFSICEDNKDLPSINKSYTKEDYLAVNRFESYGGGWGYSGHSKEAIRFSCDTDVLVGGFGLFGGRGEYIGKIRLFDIGLDGGELESEGELLAESDEVHYECSPREKYQILFDEPIPIYCGRWYVAWACVLGPSSDCGSSGQPLVTTDDHVTFSFKSSKKSNNGTDVNAGQIPQLLYRIVTKDSMSSSKTLEDTEPVSILSKQFARKVSPECFESLLRLLHWGWDAFNINLSEVQQMKGIDAQAALLDLERFVYICRACLRLIKTYINEIYPNCGTFETLPTECRQLAVCVGDTRAILKKILSDRKAVHASPRRTLTQPATKYLPLREKILDECSNTFISCFHVFYPIDELKWMALCDLLILVDNSGHGLEGKDRLLAAVMAALCSPVVKLSSLFKVISDADPGKLGKIPFSGEETLVTTDVTPRFPLLISYMRERSLADHSKTGTYTFKDLLEKLLLIIILPVKQLLDQQHVCFSEILVSNTCMTLSTLVGELAAAAAGCEIDMTSSTLPIYVTPTRFPRTSAGRSWNTGNGSPDAVCFTVDKPGIMIAGCYVYGGSMNYDFELELLDDLSGNSSNPSHTQRWNSLEIVKGTFGPEECANEVVEVKFDNPVPIKEGIKYAVRLRMHGGKTTNGEAGLSSVKGSDGTIFSFFPCSLSSNGTNHVRGQLPQIVYYSSPFRGNQENARAYAEIQATKNVLYIVGSIAKSAAELLTCAQINQEDNLIETLGAQDLFSSLLPRVLAYIGPVISLSPKSAVQVLGLLQEILPSVAALNNRIYSSAPQMQQIVAVANHLDDKLCTTSNHYALIESEHPYKPAAVAKYKVCFPEAVTWMSVEFDPQCGTVQAEDSLQLLIPGKYVQNNDGQRHLVPVLYRFSGTQNWPTNAVVLPGNELHFSLETASDYVKDDKSALYGFKCLVIGYEWKKQSTEGLRQLEKELAYLGGMCAASLLRKGLTLPPSAESPDIEDAETVEEVAEQVYATHSSILGRGYALSSLVSIHQALDGALPFCSQSNERAFLKDFVKCTPGTSGGRLARWLQPDSYVDPSKCEIICNKKELHCSWPTVITILTKDQYGNVVHVPNLKVEMKAIPIDKFDSSKASNGMRKMPRITKVVHGSAAYGGHPVPNLDVPYEGTVKDKMCYNAICMMKHYDNYSFEELRLASPTVRRPSENMLVRAQNNGSYIANWSPGCCSWYSLHVTVDGFDTEAQKVEVKEPPQGISQPPYANQKCSAQPSKVRKFIQRNSAGLRVRMNPSLQSEQIGIIRYNETLTFIDEIHNDDGVWLRLDYDSIKKYCRVNSHIEAWALQYNQHLGKTLLVPLDQPKSILDEIVKETIMRKMPDISCTENTGQAKQNGCGIYRVVKCGSSGHNIRTRPNLKAAAVGMLVLGNQIGVVDEITNSEGTWVKLDKESMRKFCFNPEGEAWSLCRTFYDLYYLQQDDAVDERLKEKNDEKGFDFSNVSQQPQPSFIKHCSSLFSSGDSEFPRMGTLSRPSTKQDLHTGSTVILSNGLSDVCDDIIGGSVIANSSVFQAEVQPLLQPTFVANGLGDEPNLSVFSDQDDSAIGDSTNVKHVPRNVPIIKPPIPEKPSLSSIKRSADIHRRVVRDEKPPDVILRDRHMSFNKDIPPELHGMSVKELVKALGESRVNGNGVTPPRSPPCTPKRSNSRSSSPRPIPSPLRGSFCSSPESRRDSLWSISSGEISPFAMTKPEEAGHPSPGTSPYSTILKSSAVHPSPGANPSAGITRDPATIHVYKETKDDSTSPFSTLEREKHSCSTLSSTLKEDCISLGSSPSGSPLRGPSPLLKQHDGPFVTKESVLLSTGKRVIQTGTQTSPLDIKGHFSIGTGGLREEAVRVSPKMQRKDRTKGRSKRDHAHSPAPKEQLAIGHLQQKEIPRQAVSPSVAECTRAVFAAFLWHEGIAHDAMACASFLKFYPNLSKQSHKLSDKPVAVINTNQRKMRHSVNAVPSKNLLEVQFTDPLHRLPVNANVTSVTPLCTSAALNEEITNVASVKRERSDSFAGGEGNSESTKNVAAEVQPELELPEALRHLVVLWDNISTAVGRVVKQHLILPSPATGPSVIRASKPDIIKDKERKIKKKKDFPRQPFGARGNSLGDLGEPLGGSETLCELCGGIFPHPVTFHMRQIHPGCGRHAGGQGYNSGGTLCGGWAGNCGDGGVGGSSWYLICDSCREKYLQLKRQASKERVKKPKKRLPAARQNTPFPALEPHLVMKSNALFLLDLATASGVKINVEPFMTPAKKQPGVKYDLNLPVLNENLPSDVNPFPHVPFQFLYTLGMRGNKASEHLMFNGIGIPASGIWHSTSACHGAGKLLLPSADGASSTDSSPQGMAVSAEGSPMSDVDLMRRTTFQRSVSAGDNDWNQQRIMLTRKRNNSSGTSSPDGSSSLLRNPSALLTKLAAAESSPDRILTRSVMTFIIQRHDLDGLRAAMMHALRKATCKIYAMQALNWLLCSVTQTVCLHDLLWHLVSALLPVLSTDVEEQQLEKKEQDLDVGVCEHPLDDISIAGEAVRPLTDAFHTLLQTISDIMMLLPTGSSVQQMAMQCFCLKFKQSDHLFLHKSHVFSNISQILSHSDETAEENPMMDVEKITSKVEMLKDFTTMVDVKVSSRQAMIGSLTDGSTETFWESGEEDRNKTKQITLTCQDQVNPLAVYVHIDNSRDLAYKVGSVAFSAGTTAEEMNKISAVDLESRHYGWVNCFLDRTVKLSVIRVDLRGPDNTLRVRQIKVLGQVEGELLPVPKQVSAIRVQSRNCESETLKVFRLLASQVFGRLIHEDGSVADYSKEERIDDKMEVSESENDLKEHMVGILFSRSKLSHLQKQVCAHIVMAICKETVRVHDEWATNLSSSPHSQDTSRASDTYCFELLSMVLALSGSVVGRSYLAQQYSLLQDLFTLLHTASPRVQRQVVSLLRRVLPEVSPQTLANILGITALPPCNFGIDANSSETSISHGDHDPNQVGILDMLLGCIAKSLSVQVKQKRSTGLKGLERVTLALTMNSGNYVGSRWWLRGSMDRTLAELIIKLLKDMVAGTLTEAWSNITKSAIAQAILSLTKLSELYRIPAECLKTPTLWLALASLCVLDKEHVEKLSSGQWVAGAQASAKGQPRPTCDNHDDGETVAIILCNLCGNLCADCDRFLHLHRKTRMHHRQVFKEEEEAIRVDLHEGCGRTKLFWVMALADSTTLKAMVEFRDVSREKGPGSELGSCRFCGRPSASSLLAIGNVCNETDCQEYSKNACSKMLPCGHQCGGISGETTCLPCLHNCQEGAALKQDADDMCMICFTEALSCAPAIQLKCTHVFHLHCAKNVLTKRWAGPRISFNFCTCPICKAQIDHEVLQDLLAPIHALYEDVRRKALMRLEYEGLMSSETIVTPGARFYNDPAGFALERYAYYVCFKCKKAYYGGEARCDVEAGIGDEYDPTELVCGACSDVSRAQMCPRHGPDFLEYKCRYCCSVAVFFCFGTTHFCGPCHDDFQRVTSILKSDLPTCPAGPRAKQLEGDECPLHVKHPPTGEEFALGCGVCRNAHTF